MKTVAEVKEAARSRRYFTIEGKLFGEYVTLWARRLGGAKMMELWGDCFLDLTTPDPTNGDGPTQEQTRAYIKLSRAVCAWCLVQWDEDGQPMDVPLFDADEIDSIDASELSHFRDEILEKSGLTQEARDTADSFREQPSGSD